MLQKCMKLWGSWIARDLGSLILDYLQPTDVLDDGPELEMLNFIRTAQKKDTAFAQEFPKEKRVSSLL